MSKYRRRYRKKGRKTNRQVWKNRKDLKFLKKAIETKVHDLTSAANDVSNYANTPYRECLNVVSKGTDADDRVGQQVLARKLLIRGAFKNNQGTAVDTCVRMIIVRDRQSQGQQIDVSALLGCDGDDPTVFSPRNTQPAVSNTKRYDIVYDRLFSMDTSQHTFIPFKISLKFNHRVEYEWGTEAGDYSDISSNSLWIVCLSEVNDNANCPQVTFESRWTYIDL